MEKVLTVSIAAYNVEPYLREALESCVVSNMNQLEVIVVDDGSKDGTALIAEEFVTTYPDTFRLISKPNGGYGSTINASLPVAKGKYYKLLDGDDWFNRDALEGYLELLRGTEVDMSLTPAREVYVTSGTTTLADKAPGVDDGIYKLRDLEFSGLLAMHTVAYRTELLRSIGLCITEHCFYTDIEFLQIPLPFVDSVLVSHDDIYQYRIGRSDQSMSINGVLKHYREHEIMLKKMIGIREEYLAQGISLPSDFERRMVREVRRQYKFLLVLPDGHERKRELREFDKYMCSHTDLLDAAEKSDRRLRFMRKTRFALSGIASRIVSRNTEWV